MAHPDEALIFDTNLKITLKRLPKRKLPKQAVCNMPELNCVVLQADVAKPYFEAFIGQNVI